MKNVLKAIGIGAGIILLGVLFFSLEFVYLNFFDARWGFEGTIYGLALLIWVVVSAIVYSALRKKG